MKRFYVDINLFGVEAEDEAGAIALTKEYIETGVLPGDTPEFSAEEET